MREEGQSFKEKSPRKTIARDSQITLVTVDKETRMSQSNLPTVSRKELAQLFDASYEAIRVWERKGKLLNLGWERIPEATNPVLYSRTSQPIDPAPPASALG